jgi:hypothetical protein
MAWTKQPDGTTIWVPQEQRQSNLSRATGQGLNSLGSALSNFFKPNQQQQAFFRANTGSGTTGQPSSRVVSTAPNYFPLSGGNLNSGVTEAQKAYFRANTGTGTMGQPSSRVVSTAKNYFPSSTGTNPTQMTSSELSRAMGSVSPTPTGSNNYLISDATQGLISGSTGGNTGGTGGGTGGGELGDATFSGVSEGTDFNALFEQYMAAGLSAANAAQAARREAAENTYQAQLRNAQTQGKQNQLAAQLARQQISEQDFMQQRALMQGAQSRGLGGSGLEQLGRTQARMQTGQNVNQLVNQEIAANEGLRNYLGDIEAKRGTALAEADAQAEAAKFSLVGGNIDNMMKLDEIQFRNKTFEWQKQNAAEAAKRADLQSSIDLITVLNDPNVNSGVKKAITAMMIDAGIVSEEEGNTLFSNAAGDAAGDAIIKDKFNWGAALAGSGAGAVGGAKLGAAIGTFILPGLGTAIGTGIGATAGGLAGFFAGERTADGLNKNLNLKVTFTDSNGNTWNGTAKDAIDKTKANSLVYQFRSRASYNDIQPFIATNGNINFRVGGQTFDTYNKADTFWQQNQG